MFASPDGESTRQIIAVDSVNVQESFVTGLTRYGSRISITSDFMIGGVLTIPSLGDQWVVERYLGRFVLVARVDFQDERRMIDLSPGDTVVGFRGKTHLFGEKIIIESNHGLEKDGVDVFNSPTITVSTNHLFVSGQTTSPNFTIEDGSINQFDFDGASGVVKAEHSGKYLVSSSFRSAGNIKIFFGDKTRSFFNTNNSSFIVPLKEGEEVSVEFSATANFTSVPNEPSSTLTLLWVGF